MSKIVLVPSYQSMALNIPVRDNAHPWIAPTQSVTLPGDLIQDHLKDYIAWYGPVTGQTQIAEWTIENNFWSRSELHEWMEANLTAPVLIQRQGDNWVLCFTGGYHNMTNFSTWFHSQRLETKFEVELTYDQDTEMKKWIQENVRGDRRMHRWGNRSVVSLRDDKDAMLFKLRWMDAANPDHLL